MVNRIDPINQFIYLTKPIISYSKLGLDDFIIFCYLFLKRYHNIDFLKQDTSIKINKTKYRFKKLLR